MSRLGAKRPTLFKKKATLKGILQTFHVPLQFWWQSAALKEDAGTWKEATKAILPLYRPLFLTIMVKSSLFWKISNFQLNRRKKGSEQTNCEMFIVLLPLDSNWHFM